MEDTYMSTLGVVGLAARIIGEARMLQTELAGDTSICRR